MGMRMRCGRRNPTDSKLRFARYGYVRWNERAIHQSMASYTAVSAAITQQIYSLHIGLCLSASSNRVGPAVTREQSRLGL